MTSLQKAIVDFRAFEATPGISVVVLPDAPVYTLVAVTNDFIRASGMKRDCVIGKSHFEIFPGNPDDPNFTGEDKLKASFQYIIQHKVPHELPIQRYDIPGQDGTFIEKYWKISNAPILGDKGEVLYIVHSAIDVTDLAKSEKLGKKTFQFLIDNSPIGIVIYEAMRDRDGVLFDFRLRSYNKRVNELTGFSSEERETYTFLQIMQTLGTLPVFHQFVSIVEKGISIEREQYIERTGKWVSFSGTKFEDGFLATLTDITEIKKTQQKLEQEVHFSKGILDSSLNGIYVLEAIRDASGKVEDFILVQGNQKFSELTGVPIEEVIGKSFVAAFPTIRQSGLLDLLCQVMESGQPHREATYYAQAFQRWYDYMAVRLDENNVVVTFQEITQIKETAIQLEKQKNLLDTILSHTPSGITVYTAIRDQENKIIDFQCILANHAAEVFTQIANSERLTKTVCEITPGLRNSPLFQMAITAVEKGEPFRTQYYREEINRWLELTVVRMYDDHLINVFTDITSIKETQVQLEKSIDELKKSNAELEQFAYVSSHDLQEPLRKIRMFNNMAMEQLGTDNSVRKYLDKVDDSAKRMTGLIRSLLDYSKLSSSGSIRYQQVDLSHILQNVLTDFELLISDKQAVIQSGQLPAIEANPLQMNQLFSNLIGNALKFTRRNVKPLITITAEKLSGEAKQAVPGLPNDKEYVQITVQDNGIGFNHEYASKIFVIFQRLNDRSAFGGYGIGLAVCKKIVDLHHGLIFANGKPQQGATFTVILPYRQR